MNVEQKRENEIARYEIAYSHPRYHMGDKRRRHASAVLATLPHGSLLDVGAGRGEGLAIAAENGHGPLRGIEPVEYLANGDIMQGIATDLPFRDASFDIVMCLDVLEHLIPEDVEPALVEMKRVAAGHILLTASENSSSFRRKGLGELHISKRPKAEWQELFEKIFAGANITQLGMIGVSPGWLIEV